MTRSKPSSRNSLCEGVRLATKVAGKLDCESCTASCATSINHSASAACFHADQKAVGTLSLCY